MSVRGVVAACALASMALAGCGSDSPAGGQGSATKPTAEASKAEPACPEQARCFEFTEDSEGWPEINDDNHFAGRDSYLDGTYRVGTRQSGSWSMKAPVRASQVSDDYGVKVDLDATLGQSFPEEAAWGATCWTRPIDQDSIAGFGVYVQPGSITVGVYDGTGAFRPLKQHEAEGVSEPGKKKHLALSCVQDTSSGSLEAKIVAEVSGTPPVSVSYANSVKNYGWQAADGLGLLAAGKGADVFYDHVVITPK